MTVSNFDYLTDADEIVEEFRRGRMVILIDDEGRENEGDLVTNGGRVAAVVARGASAEEARTAAYSGIQMVEFQGAHYRTDIGAEKQMSEQT